MRKRASRPPSGATNARMVSFRPGRRKASDGRRRRRLVVAPALAVLLLGAVGTAGSEEPTAPAAEAAPAGPTLAGVLEAAGPDDWRELDPARTLVLELEAGRVVIELAPEFAPRHVENLRTLVGQRYFDGLAILRAQDNYVVQWGDPLAEEEGARPLGDAAASVAAEMDRPIEGAPPLKPLPDPDAYAPETGFAGGFPAARDPGAGKMWLVHCYGMVGAGRNTPVDSGTPSQLYVVIGHAPRHLDRNVTLLGRVVAGMELLSSLPRGRGDLGFYEDPERRTPITAVRFAADLPVAERPRVEVLRTDTATFERWIEARRTRREEWFVESVGRVEICNVPIPAREIPRSRIRESAPVSR